MLRNRLAFALLAMAFCTAGGAAQAQSTCQIEEAQRLFGMKPRPVAAISDMLDACDAAHSTDFRVPLFRGVMERDAGHQPEAVRLLEQSRQLAPKEAVPTLELAFTLEKSEPKKARALYVDVLAEDPNSRPALLGLARLVRSDGDVDRARQIYQRLQASNPNDVDALNGLAWVEMSEGRRDGARAMLDQALVLEPNNPDALIGLSQVNQIYRYALDVGGGFVSTATGSSASMGANLRALIDARNSIEIGGGHYTNELPTVTVAGRSVLPSYNARVGYTYQEPKSFNVGLSYEFRAHSDAPGEHWVEPSAGVYLTDFLQAFASYRQGFGAAQWDNWLGRTGLAASITDNWQIVGTAYVAGQHDYNNYQPLASWSMDINYFGSRGALYSAGYGYTPTLSNVDLHARAIVPVTEQFALVLGVSHFSLNDDTRGTLGVRVRW